MCIYMWVSYLCVCGGSVNVYSCRCRAHAQASSSTHSGPLRAGEPIHNRHYPGLLIAPTASVSYRQWPFPLAPRGPPPPLCRPHGRAMR